MLMSKEQKLHSTMVQLAGSAPSSMFAGHVWRWCVFCFPVMQKSSRCCCTIPMCRCCGQSLWYMISFPLMAGAILLCYQPMWFGAKDKLFSNFNIDLSFKKFPHITLIKVHDARRVIPYEVIAKVSITWSGQASQLVLTQHWTEPPAQIGPAESALIRPGVHM